MGKILVALLLLVATSLALDVAIHSMDYRCMVVYSVNAEDHLKIDIKFPKLHEQVRNKSFYEILLTNTEDQTSERYTIQSGNFRKEIQLAESVVYKLCVKIVISDSPHQIQQYMDYNTAVKHQGSIYQQHIEVPPALLKIKDLHQSYRELLYFKYQLDELNKSKNGTKEQQEFMFLTQNQKIKKIEFISFVELAAICILGGFQYFRLKNLIESRHT